MSTAIEFNNISKICLLGLVSTGMVYNDIHRSNKDSIPLVSFFFCYCFRPIFHSKSDLTHLNMLYFCRYSSSFTSSSLAIVSPAPPQHFPLRNEVPVGEMSLVTKLAFQ